MIDHTFYKVFHFYYYFTHRNVHSQFKNNLCERAKADTGTPNQGRGATFIITEMAVFTLENDYSCEIACEQALLFGVLARLVSLAQIGELARRLARVRRVIRLMIRVRYVIRLNLKME